MEQQEIIEWVNETFEREDKIAHEILSRIAQLAIESTNPLSQ